MGFYNLLNHNTAIKHCIYCGTDLGKFVDSGRWGCMYCPSVLSVRPYPSLWQTSGLPHPGELDRLETILREGKIPKPSLGFSRSSQGKNHIKISLRYRIARNQRRTFFRQFQNAESREISYKEFQRMLQHQTTSSSYLHLPLREREDPIPLETKSYPFLKDFPPPRIYWGDEDEFRWEWIQRISLGTWEDRAIQRSIENFFRELRIGKSRFLLQKLWNRRLFAYLPRKGFVNSCPTNCGRGDRFSIVIPAWENSDNREEEWLEVWSSSGFSWELACIGVNSSQRKYFWKFSVKNFQIPRKFYFQRILVPLIVKSSGLPWVPNPSSNK